MKMFRGMVNGKMFNCPVEFLKDATSGKGDIIPDETIDDMWNELTVEQRKSLAVYNHKLWLKYTGCKVGDKINCYDAESQSIFNPFEVREDGLYTNDGFPSCTWHITLINDDDVHFEIIPERFDFSEAIRKLDEGHKVGRASRTAIYRKVVGGYVVTDPWANELTIEDTLADDWMVVQ